MLILKLKQKYEIIANMFLQGKEKCGWHLDVSQATDDEREKSLIYDAAIHDVAKN